MNSNRFYPGLSSPWLTAAFLLIFSVASLFAVARPVHAQDSSSDGVWSDLPDGVFAARAEQQIAPQKYRALVLNPAALEAQLATAPQEGSAARGTGTVLTLPLPDGAWGRFQIVESPIMAPELAAQFPEIKTYAGQGLDDPTATIRLDWTPAGFHAIILSGGDTVYIDPLFRGNVTNYASYFKGDFGPATKQFVENEPLDPNGVWANQLTAIRASGAALMPSGTQLRTYRLAMAATGEYTQFHGGTVAKALAAITTTMNRINAVYEREVAVRMVLIANNNLIIYTNGSTDPYSNSDGGAMLAQNINNLNSVIGSANYDVGHVFSTGGGGVAYLGVICNNNYKGGGVTGSSAPVGDPFDIDYVAHEIGHQFGANHTFNGNAGACSGGNRNASTAYEPGSGSTIMAYAGICGAQDLQPNSNDYFHGASYDEIMAHITQGSGNSCGTVTNTGNTPPTTNAGASYTIPKQTPFTLTGSGSDANGDNLTYNWEQFDLGAAGAPNNNTNPPFFRSFSSSTSPARTFPKWSDILNNTTTIGEILPNVTRTMNFRLTVRDNRSGGGGVNFASTTVNVTTAAGPFQVTAPNTAVSWPAGETRTVTWNVANTTAAPVSCPNVKILLSTNGGSSYPITLLAGTANDGSANVTVPNNPTTTARIQVMCANNIFFDISDVNFTITSAVAPATITIALDSQPDNVRNVIYTTNSLGSFRLDNPATDDGDSYTNSKSFTVAPGTYVITETAAANWFLNSIVCNPAGNGSVNLPARRVAITVVAGANVTCTFTDQRAGNITAIKFNDLNGNGLRASTEPYLNGWTMRLYSSATTLVATRVTADFVSGGVTNPGRARFLNVAPGVYNLCEDQQAGWSNTRPGTTNASYGNRPCVVVTVAPGTNYTIYFGNWQGVTGAAAPTERSSIVASTLLGETDDDGNELNPAPEQEIVEEEETAAPRKVYLPLIQQ